METSGPRTTCQWPVLRSIVRSWKSRSRTTPSTAAQASRCGRRWRSAADGDRTGRDGRGDDLCPAAGHAEGGAVGTHPPCDSPGVAAWRARLTHPAGAGDLQATRGHGGDDPCRLEDVAALGAVSRAGFGQLSWCRAVGRPGVQPDALWPGVAGPLPPRGSARFTGVLGAVGHGPISPSTFPRTGVRRSSLRHEAPGRGRPGSDSLPDSAGQFGGSSSAP